MDRTAIDDEEDSQAQRALARRRVGGAASNPLSLDAPNLAELRLVAGGIAHDFNNALTVILGNAAMLERELPEGSPERARVERIVGSAREASAMAEGLLGVASREPIKREPIDLAGWLDEKESSLAATLGGASRLLVDSAAALPMISADAVQLERLLAGLLSNARHAMGESGGTVWLRCGLAALEPGDAPRFFPSGRPPRGLCVYLEIENDGPALTGESRVRLFEPFFTTRPGALGLGLAAVLRIVKQHGGAIEVENDPGGGGRGVRFRVWFPVLPGGERCSRD